jgi:hypothetical protein
MRGIVVGRGVSPTILPAGIPGWLPIAVMDPAIRSRVAQVAQGERKSKIVNVTASTPYRYASLTIMALPENAIAPRVASSRLRPLVAAAKEEWEGAIAFTQRVFSAMRLKIRDRQLRRVQCAIGSRRIVNFDQSGNSRPGCQNAHLEIGESHLLRLHHQGSYVDRYIGTDVR